MSERVLFRYSNTDKEDIMAKVPLHELDGLITRQWLQLPAVMIEGNNKQDVNFRIAGAPERDANGQLIVLVED